MNHSDGGKGSKARPFSVSNEEYAKRWDAIFGKDDTSENTDDVADDEHEELDEEEDNNDH